MKFKATCAVEQDGRRARVTLHGDIVGGVNVQLHELRRNAKGELVAFDCTHMGHINSIGASEWVTFVKDVARRSTLHFHECPSTFIFYCNLVPDFLGPNGVVASFFAPYQCRPCRESWEERLVLDAAMVSDGLPERSCKLCGKPGAPQLESDEYLAFARRPRPKASA